MIGQTCLCLLALVISSYGLPCETTILLNARQATGSTDSFTQSSDVWATVIANVAPLMALVGEKNAKEFMRTAPKSMLWLIAAAPVGILSIMVSAIRLGGPRLLKQLVGRSSDRRIETLVELTALSVDPATAVYTPRSIEVEPDSSRDKVAYVCAYIGHTEKTHSALRAFKSMLVSRDEETSPGRDFELVLALRNYKSTLQTSLDVLLAVSRSDRSLTPEHRHLYESATLGFRTTGISPTQMNNKGSVTKTQFISSLLKHGSGIFAVVGLIGLQIAGYLVSVQSNPAAKQTVVMGIIGYIGVFTSSTLLLYTIREEVREKSQHFPPLFADARWSFSDSRHAEHQPLNVDINQQLYIVEPSSFKNDVLQRRGIYITILCGVIVASFVLYYLSVRVAPWWVAFGSLVIVWLGAALRTVTTRSHLEASQELQLGQHWLGMFRDTLYDSLLVTVENSRYSTREDTCSTVDNLVNTQVLRKDCEINDRTASGALLIVAKPIRQSLHSWSGCEDVIKVALELVRRKCEDHKVTFESIMVPKPHKPGLKSGSWVRMVRFRLVIFTPGIVWQSDSHIDLALTGDLNIPDIYRDLLKIIHMCGDFSGKVNTHQLTETQQVALSHVLCGPVTVPRPDVIAGNMTLNQLLCHLRDLTPPGSKCYTLEQSILIPCAQLASMRESWNDQTRSKILSFQREHIDRLALSGAAQLEELELVLQDAGVWDLFMQREPLNQGGNLQTRGNDSGHYGVGRYGGKESHWTRDKPYEDDARYEIEKY